MERLHLRVEQVKSSKMRSKSAVVLGAFLLLFSPVVAQGNSTNTTDEGYGEVVREAADLESVENMDAVYDAFGLPLALVALVPILVFLLAGAFLGEWQRREYWLLVVLSGFSAVLVLILYPFLLMHF